MSTPIAQLENVVKRYGAVTALDGVNLKLHRGELLALLGPNGAGKSTAVSLLLGLQRADAGRAELFGLDPQSLDARRRIGVMLQEAALQQSLRVDELIRLTMSYYPQPREFGEIALMAGIEELLPRRYGKLSGGQKRRVQFALAICGDPQILFLDEPTVGLDLGARTAMWKALRALVADGCAIVLTTHYLEEAEALADRVAVLARGKIIAEGSVDAIRAHVAQRRIRCVSALPAETLRNWPEVAQAEREGEHLHIVSDAAETVLRRLLAADPELRELEVRRAGLAEAFVEITESETAESKSEQKEAA
ncbi:MAG TPA: ABC transporter ATP-binding protein [Rhodanobacteraceae bacterium]|nr:ABC transporter ATP-binding protein [Rhodanobacteraceae bacterium]